MAELKTKPTSESVTDFLGRVKDEQRRKDCLAVADMMRRATGVEPKMWGSSVVGFGRYAYRYPSGHSGEAIVTGFSPRKTDLTLYLMCGLGVKTGLLSKLGKFKSGKSCLHLKRLSDVDVNVLQELIDESVKAMAKQRVE
jgi:hypothetical protein